MTDQPNEPRPDQAGAYGHGETASLPAGLPPAWSQPGGPGGRTGVSTSSAETPGFFAALFDYSFNTFITPMIIKFVYVLVTVGITIGYLVIAIATFSRSTSIGVLWLLIIGPILAVLYLALARMTLEFYLAVVRVSEDVRRAVGPERR